MAVRYRYSRWDGTQVGFELDADDVLAEITDDLLYHGDLNAALRRMLQSGFLDRDQERIAGLREILEKLRRRRRDELERYDLGGVYDDIAQELRDVVDAERKGIEELAQEARASGDERRQQITEEVAQERRMQLDLLPPDLAGQVRELQEYEFTSTEARERFDELMDRLRQQLMQSYFNEMAGALQGMSPEQMQRMKDMFNALNQLLEMREAGQETDSAFGQFMQRYGDFFPGNPQTLIEQREGRYELTPRGMRRIGQNALSDLFSRLAKDRLGRHEADPNGVGHERAYETKPYEFGDPFNLNIERTVRNALQRGGGGTPVTLAPEDFEVERTETLTRSSTVLMVDLSLSMPMRDNFLAAKKVAMALHSLISSQFPRDFLGIVGFSEVARELKPEQLPEVSWDFVYGTNMQHAFVLSRRMLARQGGTKQIIMITDGEPTAHIMSNGEVFFQYPPVPETVEATLTEVARCTREGIRINTFMLDATSYLKTFVERLTKLNRGRAFFTTPETLGDYVLVDFIEQKRALRGGRRGA